MNTEIIIKNCICVHSNTWICMYVCMQIYMPFYVTQPWPPTSLTLLVCMYVWVSIYYFALATAHQLRSYIACFVAFAWRLSGVVCCLSCNGWLVAQQPFHCSVVLKFIYIFVWQLFFLYSRSKEWTEAIRLSNVKKSKQQKCAEDTLASLYVFIWKQETWKLVWAYICKYTYLYIWAFACAYVCSSLNAIFHIWQLEEIV